MKEAGVLSHRRLVCQGHGEPLNICVQPQTLAKRAESHSKLDSLLFFFFCLLQIQTSTSRSLSDKRCGVCSHRRWERFHFTLQLK